MYAYYAQQGWTKEDVDFNIFDVYAEDRTNSPLRPDIDHAVRVPDALTIGSFAIGWNTELSPIDKEFMRRQYPKALPGEVELERRRRPYEADLAASGEVDTYHFEVATAARTS